MDLHLVRTYVRATLFWIVAPTVVLVTSALVSGFNPSSPGPIPAWVASAVTAIVLAVGFSAFAGGLALSDGEATRSRILILALASLVYGLFAYGLNAYVEPLASYYSRGEDLRSSLSPLGPTTPGVLSALRDSVQVRGVTSQLPRTSQPFGLAPAWYTFQIQKGRAFVVQVILNGLLGFLVGYLTFGLSPPVRRSARWTIGLVSAFAWLAMKALLTGRMVGSAMAFNPYLHAWGAIALHLGLVAILIPIVRERFRD